MKEFEVIFYEKKNGECPVEEFLMSLDRKIFYVGRQIVLTNGFVKKTNQTPVNEIRLAKKYREDFLERVEENEEI